MPITNRYQMTQSWLCVLIIYPRSARDQPPSIMNTSIWSNRQMQTQDSRIMLCMHPTNERWCYNVTSPLIDWAHTQNDPWRFVKITYSTIHKICTWFCCAFIWVIMTALNKSCHVCTRVDSTVPQQLFACRPSASEVTLKDMVNTGSY